MNKLKIIRYLRVVENINGIYRNYFFYGRRSKKLVLLHLTFEILLRLLLLTSHTFLVLLITKNTDLEKYAWICSFGLIIYFLSDLISVACGVLKSLEYKIAIVNLIIVHDDYIDDVNYKRNRKQTQIVVLISFTVLVIIIFTSAIYRFLNLLLLGNSSSLTFFFLILSVFRNKIICILDFFALYIYIDLLSDLLKCLNRTVLELQEKIRMGTQSFLERNGQNLHMLENVQLCSELYGCLVNSGKQLSECFKYQVNIHIFFRFSSFLFYN